MLTPRTVQVGPTLIRLHHNATTAPPAVVPAQTRPIVVHAILVFMCSTTMLAILFALQLPIKVDSFVLIVRRHVRAAEILTQIVLPVFPLNSTTATHALILALMVHIIALGYAPLVCQFVLPALQALPATLVSVHITYR